MRQEAIQKLANHATCTPKQLATLFGLGLTIWDASRQNERRRDLHAKILVKESYLLAVDIAQEKGRSTNWLWMGLA